MKQPITEGMNLMGLIRHRRYSEADFLRVQFPFHVEIEDWAARTITRSTPYLSNIHTIYSSPASWADHEGARTFGFNTEEAAQHFIDEQGGTMVKKEETT